MFASHYDKIKKSWSGPRRNVKYGSSAGEVLLEKMSQGDPNRVVQVNWQPCQILMKQIDQRTHLQSY